MIVETVLWKAVPWPGHESARLISRDQQWLLEGAAAFANEGAACKLAYAIECDSAWTTRSARVEGWVGARALDVTIEVADGVWLMNGVEQPQLDGCIDVDPRQGAHREASGGRGRPPEAPRRSPA